MTEKFCNNCFRFAKDTPNLELFFFSCAHVCCANCLKDKAQGKQSVCLVCQKPAAARKLEDALKDLKDVKVAQKHFVDSIRYQHIQQNIMFGYNYNHMLPEVEKVKRTVNAKKEKILNTRHEIKEIKEKTAKLDAYIDYYEKHAKGQLSEVEQLNRPETPPLDSDSACSSSDLDLSENSFSLK